MGLLDEINSILIGDPSVNIGSSGAFSGVEDISQLFSELLQERLGPVQEQESFRRGVGTLTDVVGLAGGRARQRLGDVSVAGGFFDSGARIEGLLEIERGEQAELQQGINQLFQALEDRRTQGVFEFLSGASREFLGAAGIEVGAETAGRGQNLAFVSSLTDTLFQPTPTT